MQWYHENWSDASATSWSLRGASQSPSESRDRMISQLTKTHLLFYAVFATPANGEEVLQHEGDVPLGEHLGSVSLRRQPSGPTLRPPLLSPTAASLSPQSMTDLQVLGYAFFEAARGKGYATEANRALLDAYAAAVAAEKAMGEKPFYVEACVDEGNPGSKAVLRKLGFKEVGWKEEEGTVFLGGEWREAGYWVWGLYV